VNYLIVIVHIFLAIATLVVWGAMRVTPVVVVSAEASARNWAARLIHAAFLAGCAAVGSGWSEHRVARVVAVAAYVLAATVGESVALPAERRLRRGVGTDRDARRFTRGVDVVLVALAIILAAMVAQY
jgi:hypothetical protein